MQANARAVRVAVVAEKSPENTGVGTLPAALKNYFTPDALDTVLQDVAQFSNFRKAAQAIRRYLVEFDLLRREPEDRMLQGGTSLWRPCPIMRNRWCLPAPMSIWRRRGLRNKCDASLVPFAPHQGTTF